MRRSLITTALCLLLVGLLSAARTATSQGPLPTPRGQLGGRPPLALTPAVPAPTQEATAVPEGIATPLPVPMATPSGTPGGTPVASGDDAGADRSDASS